MHVFRRSPAPSWGLGPLPDGLHALLHAQTIDGGLEGSGLDPLLLSCSLLFLQAYIVIAPRWPPDTRSSCTSMRTLQPHTPSESQNLRW